MGAIMASDQVIRHGYLLRNLEANRISNGVDVGVLLLHNFPKNIPMRTAPEIPNQIELLPNIPAVA